MNTIAFHPNYIGYFKDNLIEPFLFSASDDRPSSDFVISRSLNGVVLSTYSDDLWDLRPYRLSGDTGNARFNFDVFDHSLKEEVKWLMFLLLFVSDSGKSTGLSVSSCMNYFKAIRGLARYCMEQNISIKHMIQDEFLMVDFVKGLNSRSLLRGLSSVLSHLITIPNDVSGYIVLSRFKFDFVKKRLNDLGDDSQHPVIPVRIFSELISQIDSFISNFYEIKEKISLFIDKIVNCEGYARSIAYQKDHGYDKFGLKPSFNDAAKEHDILEYLKEYKVTNALNFSTFLLRVQHAVRVFIHIFSGIRAGESLSLKIGCLKYDGETYNIVGTTSKMVGQKKVSSWVTCEEVVKGYEIAEMLAEKVSKVINISKYDTPLFISTGYLSIGAKVHYDGVSFSMANASIKKNEIYNLLDEDLFKVESEDLNELEKINPFRAWQSENGFSIGDVWRFTIHQFRRSLAFYVAQSALVSLPSLKRQLKHITREMTIYYSKSMILSEEFSGSSHIANLIKGSKPEADAIAYINEVLNSEESLYGAHGLYLERNNLKLSSGFLFENDRDDIIKQFKNGEIAYSETALGACTTITPCDKKLFRSTSSCLSCDRSVIKESRLKRVIEKQKIFVENLSEILPDSIEYRTENEELTDLLNYQKRMSNNGEK